MVDKETLLLFLIVVMIIVAELYVVLGEHQRRIAFKRFVYNII